MKKAFTLAEVMIVLTVIGILSAVLMPVAFHAAPDKNAMKFKKAHNVMGTVIRELVSSDQYYQDGDLGKRVGGATLGATFLCQTMADVLTVKSQNCTSHCKSTASVTVGTLSTIKANVDTYCKNAQNAAIVTSDDVTWFESCSSTTFAAANVRGVSGGFVNQYKVLCFDVDGISQGEDPFGYAVRYDGKIIPGARADAWTQKSIQRGD